MKYITILEAETTEYQNVGTITTEDIGNRFKEAIESHFDATLISFSFVDEQISSLEDCISASPIDCVVKTRHCWRWNRLHSWTIRNVVVLKTLTSSFVERPECVEERNECVFLTHPNSPSWLIDYMEQWKSILIKFLKHFYLDYEEDTAEDYLGDIEVESIQTKNKSGGYCSITGMPFKYDQPSFICRRIKRLQELFDPRRNLSNSYWLTFGRIPWRRRARWRTRMYYNKNCT